MNREKLMEGKTVDLQFPANIEFAYYSIYTLFHKCVDERSIDDWFGG